MTDLNLNLIEVLFVLFLHYVGDFILQKNSWAQNKSSSLESLSAHVLTYSIFLYLATILVLLIANQVPNYANLGAFVWVNLVAHFATDFISSRTMARLVHVTDRGPYAMSMWWTYKERREFFLVLGLDQLAHYVVLFITYALFLRI